MVEKHLKLKFYFIVKSEAKLKKKNLSLQIYFKENADIVASQIYSNAVCQWIAVSEHLKINSISNAVKILC